MIFSRSIRSVVAMSAMALLVAACAPAPGGQVTATTPEGEVLQEVPVQDIEAPSDAGETEGGSSVSDDPFGGVSPRFRVSYWPNTDFSKHSVDYSEIRSGGPPPDGIPAIDNPVYESVEKANVWLDEDWPVMFFEWNGDARAYPLAILVFHEIVNDMVGDLPVTLTFCPLCNATIAFSRTLPDGTVLDFGTSGNLRNSDLIMYDRQTHSWWQQFTGEAIVGDLTGTKLEFLPSQIIAWSDFVENHPEGRVLSRDTGHFRNYGQTPYPGYDQIDDPFLFEGETDGRLRAVERVAAIEINGVHVAYPFTPLSEVQVVNDDVGGKAVVVFWKGGTISSFSVANLAPETGSTSVFLREVDGEVLTFKAAGGGFEDEQTGSLWNIFGEAVEGPMIGTRLEQVVSAEHFWFAWAAFKPDTVVWSPGS